MTDDKPHKHGDAETLISFCEHVERVPTHIAGHDTPYVVQMAIAEARLIAAFIRAKLAPAHKHGDLSYEASATHWHAEVVRLRARVDVLEGERERVAGVSWSFFELLERIAEADRKHPRDIADGSHPRTDAYDILDFYRDELARSPSWLAALKCEVVEAQFALVAESPDRLADELLDVATVALRWRRAILERGTE